MMASNKIDITCKYLLTQFTWTVTTQISILQHIILSNKFIKVVVIISMRLWHILIISELHVIR